MKTIQHKAHSTFNMKALATLLVVACLWLARPLSGQESKIDAAEPSQSLVQGLVTALEDQSTPLEGIPLKLSGESSGARSLSAVTDAEGRYEFSGLGAGTYLLETSLEGFKPFAKTVVLNLNERRVVNVALEVATVSFKVDVEAQAPTLAEQSSAPDATLTNRQFLALPLAEQKFKDALPLVPGVVRTWDGKLNIKGEVESQGMLLVDSAQLVDPITGSLAIAIPIDAIQSLNVYKTPYNAEYGSFTGGLSTIETKAPSGSWKYGVNDFIPGARGRDGQLVGISAETPRVSLSGPIIKGKLNFSEVFDYTLRKKPVRGLAWPDNETITQGFNSFTSFQAILSSRHLLTTTVDVFPMRTQYANISSLVPQSASSNYGQTGFSIGVTDSYQFESGALLSTVFRYTRFYGNAYGQGPQDMLLTPEGWGGNFFNTWNRTGNQFEALPIYQLMPRSWHGSHELKFGEDFIHRSFTGSNQSRPIQLLREDGSLAQRIDFQGGGSPNGGDTEVSEFVQDHWTLNDHLALNLGARLTHESIGRSAALAPRVGLAYSPGEDRKTIIRAGAGLFYDRVPLLASGFSQNPMRVVSSFDQTGSAVGAPIVFQNIYLNTEPGLSAATRVSDLGTSPRNFTWNVEVDRELTQKVMLRLSYVQSQTRNLFVLNPQLAVSGQDSTLGLAASGSSHYRELEATVRYRPSSRSELTVSYVRSQARGDLNTLSGVFVPFEQPVIRPNVYTHLNSDIPNRLVSTGIFQLPWKLTFSPVVDIHTGFPYSEVDELQDYVGQPNGQRFPTFFSLDIKVYREMQFPFSFLGPMKHRKFRLGFYSLNLTNHLNPRDVYNNIASPYFGDFAGFQHRVNGMVIDVVN
jgi:hypothetical protein